jgi:threonine/homoserine/homoserine lactone efflux protein
MLDAHLFALFMLGAVALNLVPGPDMTFVLAQSMRRGARAGLAAAFGIAAGACVHMTTAAFGLSALFAAAPLAFTVLRYAGAAYLVWIAVGMIRHHDTAPVASPAPAAARAFRQGFLTNLLNPKVALFFIAFLPQFVSPAIATPTWAQVLLLGLAFNASGTVVNAAVALGSARLAARLRGNRHIARAISWIAGGLIGALALRLAWPERR